MKPTPLSEFLATPAANRVPGWVVVVRGAGAPSVVHASRGAAEAEANRLIGGLPGTVDQTALVMPIASVLTRKKDVRQPVVGEAFPIGTEKDDTLGSLAVKRVLRDFNEEARAMEALCGKARMGADLAEIADATDHSRVVDVPFVIKEHGIYERRDGKIVSITRFTPDGVIATQDDGEVVYSDTGRANYQGDDDAPHDLVREIVVGEGWKPWNGGECPLEPRQMVEVVTRGNVRGERPAANYCWNRYTTKHSKDIVAYREAMPF